MRIAHVVASIGNLAAGPSYSVPALCDAMVRAGHGVELHVLNTGGATRRPAAGYELHAYPFLPGGHKYAWSNAMLLGLFSAARRCDVMHWHGLWAACNVFPAWAARGTDCRLVVSPRGMLEAAALQRRGGLKRLLWLAVQGPAVRSALAIHVTSAQEAASVRAVGLPQPIALIENGVDVPQQGRLLTPGSDRSVLYLGRLHPIKALDHLVSAWARVEATLPGWRLDLVGPSIDGHGEQLNGLSRQLGCQRVRVLPPVFGRERDDLMRRADLFVLPSHSENFAMTVAEALAVGLPVIASRGTPWSALERERCGRWVDNDAAALAQALTSACSQPASELEAMGARGRAWMQRSFSWGQKAREMAEVYDWIGHGGTPPRCILTASGESVPNDSLEAPC